MKFFANPHIHRLAAHSTLHQLATCVSGVFGIVFLLRAGITPTAIFLAIAGLRVLRFVLRPLVLLVIPAFGLRRTLMFSTLLIALVYPVLAFVNGPGLVFVAYVALLALAETFYYTCYHVAFAVLGDAEYRGSQLGMTQGLSAIASVLGPAVGGATLAGFGPWAAFGVSALIEALAVLPLRNVGDVPLARATPREIFASAQRGVFLFLTDGWIATCVSIAWDVIMFRALGGRFDVFGGVLAAAALIGALGGVGLGRFIDISRARYAAWINGTVCATAVLLKAGCGNAPAAIVLTASVAAVLGAFYGPSLMTAVYNDAKRSACALRFQFAAEACWDIGSALACSAAAAACLWGLSLQSVILMALPVVALQAAMLSGRYEAHGEAQVEFGG